MSAALQLAAPRERPVLFSAPMVRAILEGRKTQTRRLLRVDSGRKDGAKLLPGLLQKIGVGAACPHGAVGDRLWVRETFYCDHCFVGDLAGSKVGYLGKAPSDAECIAEWREELYFRADGEPHFEADEVVWTPSIFMPRWASRLTLEITSVRAERLQEISEEDAKAEGVVLSDWESRDEDGHPNDREFDHRAAFSWLWDSINGDRAPWSGNPWVWVIGFRRAA